MTRRLIGVATALLVLGATAPAASGDGLPIPTEVGFGGVTTPRSDARFTTHRAGRDTVVDARALRGGALLRSLRLRGKFVVPAVALDGSAGGLSGDGGTLALISPRSGFPRARTKLAVVDARLLRLRAIVQLRGDFSFDAISPDGRSLYLIQYLSGTDPTHYAVRAYDVATTRLRPGKIVDPHERGEAMRGFPTTRAYSPDGRWAYTVYDGDVGHSFIHALDTSRATAVCIDTPQLDGGKAYDVHVTPTAGGRTLAVIDGRKPLLVVDTRTFRVSKPVRPRSAAAPRGHGGDDDSLPLAGLAAAAVLFAGGAVGLGLRRRRRLTAAA
jgi:hypothetical protein